MRMRFGNMESLLIVGIVLFLYTTLVKTAIHDDVINELTTGILEDVKYNRQMSTKSSQENARVSLAKRDENKMRHVDVGSALKREIIHALVKILYDELEKKTTVQLLKKQIMDKFTENDLTNELKKKRASDKVTERRVVNKVTASDEHKVESDTIRPPGLWKRHEEKSEHAWRKDEDKNVAADDLTRRRLIRGPPGLWGRDVSAESKVVSDHGPPGLWGRDAAKALLAAEESQKFSDELSNNHLFEDEKDTLSNDQPSTV